MAASCKTTGLFRSRLLFSNSLLATLGSLTPHQGVGFQPSEGLDYRGWRRDTTVASLSTHRLQSLVQHFTGMSLAPYNVATSYLENIKDVSG